jgi:hypothetical protein
MSTISYFGTPYLVLKYLCAILSSNVFDLMGICWFFSSPGYDIYDTPHCIEKIDCKEKGVWNLYAHAFTHCDSLDWSMGNNWKLISTKGFLL